MTVATLAALAALVIGSGTAAWAQQPPAPPPDAVGAVHDIIGEVESLDGTESETRKDKTVTLALTSDVLFAFDKADLVAQARERLRKAAERIKADGAGGPVRIEGHTDDQGSDAYNDGLSQRRAEAVRTALAALLAGQSVTLQARGFGERRPKLPNVVGGKPSARNRARNRRVEIIFDAKQ
jgi:outer membrane protein OmpA-like peptidoglycan-associated protein